MKTLPGLIVLACIIALAASAAELADRFETKSSETSVQKIYWSDGDSGRLDGMPFRLSNVDAPEKGGVGARGGAKCEKEREIAFEVKAAIIDLTRNADVKITRSLGEDRYGRAVVELSVNGRDLAELGLEKGYYRPWPHKGQRALAKKPDWCGSALLALNEGASGIR